jgi:hypothetical protein
MHPRLVADLSRDPVERIVVAFSANDQEALVSRFDCVGRISLP